MLQELKTHHREIARLKFEGMTTGEIALRLDTTQDSIKTQLKDPLCKAHMTKLNYDADETALAVRKRLARLSVAAIERYEEILDQKSVDVPWPVVQSVAKDTLDRAGHKPPEKHEHSHAHFTIDDLKALRERATARKPPRQVNAPQERQTLEEQDSEVSVSSDPKARHALGQPREETITLEEDSEDGIISTAPTAQAGGSQDEQPAEPTDTRKLPNALIPPSAADTM